ncbi:MAG: peptidyl-prolyl cis-trans isomerase, partial [Hyphomicrobiales bacterium]
AKAYYEKHLNRYEVPPEITFTHVFFSNRKHSKEGALELAGKAVEELNAQSVPFSNASRFGERFPYNLNYVERTLSYVMSHFGKKAATEIFALEPSEAIWYGPFVSEFGAHVVMVIKRQDGRVLEFDEVRPQVIDALKQEQVRKKTENAVNEVVKGYTIQVAPDIAALGKEKAQQ